MDKSWTLKTSNAVERLHPEKFASNVVNGKQWLIVFTIDLSRQILRTVRSFPGIHLDTIAIWICIHISLVFLRIAFLHRFPFLVQLSVALCIHQFFHHLPLMSSGVEAVGVLASFFLRSAFPWVGVDDIIVKIVVVVFIEIRFHGVRTAPWFWLAQVGRDLLRPKQHREWKQLLIGPLNLELTSSQASAGWVGNIWLFGRGGRIFLLVLPIPACSAHFWEWKTEIDPRFACLHFAERYKRESIFLWQDRLGCWLQKSFYIGDGQI